MLTMRNAATLFLTQTPFQIAGGLIVTSLVLIELAALWVVCPN